MISPIVEQDLIVAQVTSVMSPIPVIEDDTDTTTYVNGEPAPYVFVDFGSPVATFDGRGITGEAKQPFTIRCSVAYVAGSRTAARAGAATVASLMTGFVASSNSGPLRLVGGASYTLEDDSTKPVRYVGETFFAFTSNMDVEP